MAVALLLPLVLMSVAEARSGVAPALLTGAIPVQQAAGAEHPSTCQYRPVRHETIDGIGISVIERVAPLPGAVDPRITVWIDDGEHRIWKIELHDSLGGLLFTVRYLRYEQRGGEWTPTAIYVLDQRQEETRVVRELHEIGGVNLDEVQAAAVSCAPLN